MKLMIMPEFKKIKQRNDMIRKFLGGNFRQEIRSFYLTPD